MYTKNNLASKKRTYGRPSRIKDDLFYNWRTSESRVQINRKTEKKQLSKSVKTQKYLITETDFIEYKKKYFSRLAVRRALKKGLIQKPSSCEICDHQCNLDAHHVDYGKPLQVYWLCSACHGIVHRRKHPLNPCNNDQTNTNLTWNKQESAILSLSIPFENFIALSKLAKDEGKTVNKLISEMIQVQFPVNEDQLSFKFGKKYDDTRRDTNEMLWGLESNQESLFKSKSDRLQQIRWERDKSLF